MRPFKFSDLPDQVREDLKRRNVSLKTHKVILSINGVDHEIVADDVVAKEATPEPPIQPALTPEAPSANEHGADMGEAALAKHSEEMGITDVTTRQHDVVNLLIDLAHVCDRFGMNFSKLCVQAINHHADEVGEYGKAALVSENKDETATATEACGCGEKHAEEAQKPARTPEEVSELTLKAKQMFIDLLYGHLDLPEEVKRVREGDKPSDVFARIAASSDVFARIAAYRATQHAKEKRPQSSVHGLADLIELLRASVKKAA